MGFIDQPVEHENFTLPDRSESHLGVHLCVSQFFPAACRISSALPIRNR